MPGLVLWQFHVHLVFADDQLEKGFWPVGSVKADRGNSSVPYLDHRLPKDGGWSDHSSWLWTFYNNDRLQQNRVCMFRLP